MNTLEKQLDDLAKTADKLKQAHEKLVGIPEVFVELGVHEDPVNPDHYKNQTSLECIEAMEIIFGEDAVLDFCLCNAWKYIWRWKNKNGTIDLEKANWYIIRAFQYLQAGDHRLGIAHRIKQYILDLNMEE